MMQPVYPDGTQDSCWVHACRPVDDDLNHLPDDVGAITYRHRRFEEYARANGAGFDDVRGRAKSGWG